MKLTLHCKIITRTTNESDSANRI